MPPAERKPSSVDSIDVLRGLVMLLLAVDHAREFFHHPAAAEIDPAGGSLALFFTRWITQFAAPVLVFLVGTSVFLSETRSQSRRELSRFLVTRGLSLIALELTWIHWAGWSFAIPWKEHSGLLIWALGWSMISLAALIHLPRWAIATVGIGIITLHNALDFLTPESFGAIGWLWKILHDGGEIALANGFQFNASFPILPWIGVIATGYTFGPVMQKAPDIRQHWLLRVGINLTVVFFLLRFTNLYGNATAWTSQPTGLRTLLSILDCTKLPPSLCHLLMTLGPAAILLAWLDLRKPEFLKPLLVIGRVPLFFYLLHLPIIHGLAIAVNLIRYNRADWLYGSEPAAPPPDAGFDLDAVYLAWAVSIIILYPACQWFADLKHRRNDPWLRHL